MPGNGVGRVHAHRPTRDSSIGCASSISRRAKQTALERCGPCSRAKAVSVTGIGCPGSGGWLESWRGADGAMSASCRCASTRHPLSQSPHPTVCRVSEELRVGRGSHVRARAYGLANRGCAAGSLFTAHRGVGYESTTNPVGGGRGLVDGLATSVPRPEARTS